MRHLPTIPANASASRTLSIVLWNDNLESWPTHNEATNVKQKPTTPNVLADYIGLFIFIRHEWYRDNTQKGQKQYSRIYPQRYTHKNLTNWRRRTHNKRQIMALGRCLIFFTNLSLLFAIWTLGRTKLKADWQNFTTSISLVLNNFIKNLLTGGCKIKEVKVRFIKRACF